MTNEELLAKLWILPADVTELQHGAKAVQALRAIVVLHKANPEPKNNPFKDHCRACGKAYPCKTIQAIEKELQ